MPLPSAAGGSCPGDSDTKLTLVDLRGVALADIRGRLPRPEEIDAGPVEVVRDIIAEVRRRGDAALFELTSRLDGVALDSLRVPAEDITAAVESTPSEVVDALALAHRRIADHHGLQRRGEIAHHDQGVSVRTIARPVGSAGCYVPGGRAAYPSTLLMTAVPARVAGVERVVVCVPPDRDTGEVAGVTLAAAALAGVDELYAVGGAQAIAAMAYGTETIDSVDVVCGPGNLYVAVAKQQVAGVVGVAAAFAGPSEVVVIADGSVEPELVAVDLMLQAEHGPDGMAWLITWDPEVPAAVDDVLGALISAAPRRAEISATLARSGFCVLVDSPVAAIAVSDIVAPEHLELLCKDASELADSVHNAGAVFCGASTPASIGDYVAGPSHVLPTHRSARFASALSVEDFIKHIHVISASPEGLQAVGPAAAALASAEGLDAHARSIRMRLDGAHGEALP